MKRTIHNLLLKAIFLTTLMIGCKQEKTISPKDSSTLNFSTHQSSNGRSSLNAITVSNAGFESNWSSWNDSDPSAISGDANSGSKSAKITGSSGRFEQTINVTSNRNYELKAYIKGKGKIGAISGNSDFNDGGNYSDWTQVTVSFNSGSSSTITIYGAYNGGEGRFDDFELFENSGVGEGGSTSQLNAVSVSASANDGNVPANTIDGNLGTRWSANGIGQYITFDLGASKTISHLKVAWYKGEQRISDFKIRVGNSTSSLSTVYDGLSSGNTLDLETVDFDDVSARYIRITGFGNSSNSWNSITEVEIYGEGGGNNGDTTPPGAVSNLSANAGNGQVTLTWSNPADNDYSYTQISYNGNSQSASSESVTISNLNNGTTYTFTVKAYDNSGNGSTGKTVTAIPQGGGSSNYPTDIIPGLTDWKITLPIDENGDDSSGASHVDNRNKNAHEVKDNNLIGYEYTPYFHAENGEVIFRAHCAGATTSGSKYPRSELRQRVGGGDNYWSVNNYQYLQTELRVTNVPVEKPEVSMVQIHGPSDEPLRVQYHADIGVYIIWNESNKDTENALDYTLGESLRVSVTVDNGDITCLIENLDRNISYSKTWASSDNTGYFKVGCYTQSSIFLSDFKSGYNNEPLNAYGEIAVKNISLVENY